MIYKEELTKNKVISLLVCFIGALLAVTGGKLELKGISMVDMTIGVELSVVGIIASVELVVSLMVVSTVIVLRGNNNEHNYVEENAKVEIV